MTITALGQSWDNQSKPAPPGTAQPPQADPPRYGENMWVPGNVEAVGDSLRLTLRRNTGYCWQGRFVRCTDPANEVWGAAEAVLDVPDGKMLGYGKYVVTLKAAGTTSWSDFLHQAITTTLGIFIYDPAGSHGEIDLIEVGRQNQPLWNPAGANPSWIYQQPPDPPHDSNAQFVIQPWDAGNPGHPSWGHTHRILIDDSAIPASGELSVGADWSAAGAAVRFGLAYGAYDATSFPWAGAPISWTSQAAAPAATPTMSLYLNLWPYGGSNTGDVTFEITGLSMPAFVDAT